MFKWIKLICEVYQLYEKHVQSCKQSNWSVRFLSLALLCLAIDVTASDFIKEDYQLSDKEVRVGEAYYRADMKWMVYQAEVSESNPFYQIYLKDLVSGKVQQVSQEMEKQRVPGCTHLKRKCYFHRRTKIQLLKRKCSLRSNGENRVRNNPMRGITMNIMIFTKQILRVAKSKSNEYTRLWCRSFLVAGW